MIYPCRKIEKKSLKEMLRLSLLLHEQKNEAEIKEIEAQIKICEILKWKDYKKLVYKKW